ncbi:MAG: hypothetical protein NVS3B28_29150 [Candidatus Velthaea sp.]
MAQIFRRMSAVGCIAAAALLLGVQAPGRSATTGIAFDSVTKIAIGGDANVQPGTFASDFATAGTPIAAGNGKRGPFGLGAVLAAASGAMTLVKNGTAEHHYIAGSKQRVDTIATGEARIVDCSARTLTTLDLNKKTYTVASLDRPVESAPADAKRRDRNAPDPAPSDDGTKVALDMTTRALGPRPIDGIAANGFNAHMKMTTTKPTGESAAIDTDLTSYFSTMAEPRDGCPEAESRLHAHAAGPSDAAMAQYFLAMRAMKTPKGDPRFTVTSSGTPMPTGKFALWQNITMGAGAKNGAVGVLIERGNVRSIADSDPIFSVPPDFTKVASAPG